MRGVNHVGSFHELNVYAEARAKRRYEKHCVSKLSDADAEQMETQHWLGEACDCHYLDDKRAEDLLAELRQIGRMLNSMMDLFCRRSSNTDHWSPLTGYPMTAH